MLVGLSGYLPAVELILHPIFYPRSAVHPGTWPGHLLAFFIHQGYTLAVKPWLSNIHDPQLFSTTDSLPSADCLHLLCVTVT